MPVDRTQLRLNAFNRKRLRLGEDTCDLIKPNFAEGGATGDTVSPTTVATNLRCFYESRSGNSQVVIGGQAYSASHNITIENTSASIAITPDYKLKIHARGANPEKIFEQLVIRDGSFTPLAVVAANLVTQGYQ